MENWYKKAMQDEPLLTVTHITDDDTGAYVVGEVDFGISGALDEYLERHGEKGKSEIIKTLDYLKSQVEEKWVGIKSKKVNHINPRDEELEKNLRYERNQTPMADDIRKNLGIK